MPIPVITIIARILASKEKINPFPDNAKVPIKTATAIAKWAIEYIMENSE